MKKLVILAMLISCLSADEALTVYKNKCKSNNAKACFELSHIYYVGKGVDRNLSLGNFYSKKSCDLGNEKACWSLGYAWRTGYGVPKVDMKKAQKYLKIACDKNIPNACSQLADILYYHNKKADKYYFKAKKAHEKMCDKKDNFSCGYLVRDYSLGKFEPINIAKANEYSKKECAYNNNQGGCIDLAYSYLNGSRERNVSNAEFLLQEGCELRFGFACSLLGDIYTEKGDTQKAKGYYKQAIRGYTDLADDYYILYDFNKLCEVSLITDKKVDKRLEERFLKQYKDYDDYLINYKIIKLFEAIYRGKNPNIEEFIKKYGNVKIRKDELGYDFTEIKVWIDNMKDKKMKQHLLKAYKIIEKNYLH